MAVRGSNGQEEQEGVDSILEMLAGEWGTKKQKGQYPL